LLLPGNGVPRVLLVTGAYYPEISAAAVQCRAAAAALHGRARFSVLTTATNRGLSVIDTVDGVLVRRVTVDVRSGLSKALAALRFFQRAFQGLLACDVMHVHGFSRKNVPSSLLARLLGKRLVLTLHTAGQDEPQVIRQSGGLAYWAFKSADLVLCVSPFLGERCRDAEIPAARVRLTPNGVDTTRFRPAEPAERLALRRTLGWPETQPVILFVGFFSRDKRPDLLYRAWRRLRRSGYQATLVYVGAKRSGYYEIDESLIEEIKKDATASGLARDLLSVEPTNEIEQYYRAADVFVLPSVREAHPLALLEAMACGVPSIATRLAGATDVLIEDGHTGRLVPPDDESALTTALSELLTDQSAAWAMGARARETVEERYDIRDTAEKWLAAYQTVLTHK
jgi:glycosyltransferase involved in cell wall biosynthesis